MFACMYMCVIGCMSVLCVFMGGAQHWIEGYRNLVVARSCCSQGTGARCPCGLPYPVALTVPCPVLCLALVAWCSLFLTGKPELPRQPGSTAQYDAEAGSPEAEITESDSPQSSSTDTNHFLHTLDWQGKHRAQLILHPSMGSSLSQDPELSCH